MGNFNRDNRGGRGGGFGGNRGGGFGGDRDRTMHKATCSSCGKECEVPFRPSGDKPVYCNDCFSKTSVGSDRAPRRDFGSRPQQRPSFDGSNQGGSDTKRQLEAISAKLDKLTQAIENFSQPKKAEAKATEKAAPKAAPKAVVKAPAKKAVKKVVAKKGKK